MGKGKFIDKKNSATFQLLARDTSDPNYSGRPSGDRVFVRVDNNPYTVPGLDDELLVDDQDSMFADAPDDCSVGYGYSGSRTERNPLPDDMRREIIELGFPDDGYNYLLHLRDIKNTGGGSVYYQNPKAKLDQLPPDIKAYNASRVEITRVGEQTNEESIYPVASKVLNAKIEKVVDGEIQVLLDNSDFSDMEDLEEDFVVKANLAEGSNELEFELD